MSKIKTNGVTGIIDVTRELGDNLMNQYNQDKDLKVCQTALDAYKTAVSAGKAQLIYKKMTGRPGQIDFFE